MLSYQPPLRDAEGDERWWEAARTMAGSLPRMGKQSKDAIRAGVLAQAAADLGPVPKGKALSLAEAAATKLIVTAIVAGANATALGISTILGGVLIAAAASNVEPPIDVTEEATGHRDTRADRAQRREGTDSRQPPPPGLPKGCWTHVQRQPGPALRARMRHSDCWGPTQAQIGAKYAAWDRTAGADRRRAAEASATAALTRVGDERPVGAGAPHAQGGGDGMTDDDEAGAQEHGTTTVPPRAGALGGGDGTGADDETNRRPHEADGGPAGTTTGDEPGTDAGLSALAPAPGPVATGVGGGSADPPATRDDGEATAGAAANPAKRRRKRGAGQAAAHAAKMLRRRH